LHTIEGLLRGHGLEWRVMILRHDDNS